MQRHLIFTKRNNNICFHFYCKMYFSTIDQPIIIDMPVMRGIFSYIKSSVTIINTASKMIILSVYQLRNKTKLITFCPAYSLWSVGSRLLHK